MTINTINRIKTIAYKLNANSDSIITIYENSGLTVGNELIKDHKIISFNCFIKNLKAFASIQSLDEVSLPNFELDDSATDKLYKTLNVEWQSPRKQISLYISSGYDWYKVGSISLLNPSGYPYRIYNLMDLFTDNLAIELGDNGKIGIQIEDVGFGLLDTSDTVTIHGSYSEEIFVQVPETIYTPPTGGTSNGGGSTAPQFPVSTAFRISANDLNLTGDRPVENWQSQTGIFAATQLTPENQPVFKANVLNNGKGAVYFDGINKSLNVPQTTNDQGLLSSIVPLSSNWLIFVVAKFDDPLTDIISALNSAEGDINQSLVIAGNQSRLGHLNSDFIYEELIVNYSLNAGWNTYIISRQGEAITIYINGASYPLGNWVDSSYDRDFTSISIGCNYSNANYFSGYIADLGIMANHSLIDVNTIGNYFKALYNLTWVNV